MTRPLRFPFCEKFEKIASFDDLSLLYYKGIPELFSLYFENVQYFEFEAVELGTKQKALAYIKDPKPYTVHALVAHTALNQHLVCLSHPHWQAQDEQSQEKYVWLGLDRPRGMMSDNGLKNIRSIDWAKAVDNGQLYWRPLDKGKGQYTLIGHDGKASEPEDDTHDEGMMVMLMAQKKMVSVEKAHEEPALTPNKIRKTTRQPEEPNGPK
ncbi:MAG: hypothetical protein WCG04_00475 [Alphaproteobacteria bacterium]